MAKKKATAMSANRGRPDLAGAVAAALVQLGVEIQQRRDAVFRRAWQHSENKKG